MNGPGRSRRDVLAGATVAILGSITGCSSTSDGEPRLPEPQDETSETVGTSTRKRSWLANVDNYDGYANHQGQDRATVRVGVPGENGNRWFEPAGLLVSSQTTVVWKWTGKGEHGVTERNGAFESEITSEADYTFEYTVGKSDILRYYCPNHRQSGMKGAVLVQ